MQKIIDFIKIKALTDPSMANLYDLVLQHPGKTEDVLLIGFKSLYEANRKIMTYMVKEEQNKKSHSLVDSTGSKINLSK